MKVYISGPISGQDRNEATSRFTKAKAMLRKAGVTPISPMDIGGWGLSWSTYMKIAFDVLSSGEVDAVFMLKGWKESHGARLERYLAQLHGIHVTYEGGAVTK